MDLYRGFREVGEDSLLEAVRAMEVTGRCAAVSDVDAAEDCEPRRLKALMRGYVHTARSIFV